MSDWAIPRWATRLVDDDLLDKQKLHDAVETANTEGNTLDQTLLELKLVDEEAICLSRALEFAVPFVDPRDYAIELSNCALLPEDLARANRMFPLFAIDDVITLGMEDPGNLALVDQVRLRTALQVEPCVCPPSVLDALVDRAYSLASASESVNESGQAWRDMVETELKAKPTGTIVKLVKTIVEEAVRDGASDIHIEPERDKLRVRLRVDGIMHERSVLALEQHAPIVSRIKIESKLDIAETRKPQDGHFSSIVPQGEVDVRVSTIPTVHGENVVMRLLLSGGKAVELDEVGMPPPALSWISDCLDHPHGMILVTGPTGSGKTTTLYSAMKRLNTVDRNIVTIEDPVEKRVPLLRQTQVNPRAGVTFAAGLRSILRQDPDVIMIGEIRDQETANIAVQAALTGHLVLSTLHTNTAAGALVRLSEMGIAPFMITSSLRAVIGQRLVRRICDACKQPVELDPELVTGLGLDDLEDFVYMEGAGCARCLHSGFKGRVGLFELLHITSALSRAVLQDRSRDAIEEEAEAALICSLVEDGRSKVAQGLTTVGEVARIVGLSTDSRQAGSS